MKKRQPFIYGTRAVIEALKDAETIDKILVSRTMKSENLKELLAVANDYFVPVQKVPVEKLNRLTPGNHQGVIAFISPIIYQDYEEVILGVFEKGETPFVLILDSVTDVRNFGAIARSADCAGVHAILIPDKGVATINEDAVKTSAGALLTIPVCRTKNLRNTVIKLKEYGLTIVACTEKSDDLIYSVDYTQPTGIIMGSEGEGISPDLLKAADHLAKIPLAGSIESLNVSNAASIVLYEAVRQRLSI